MWSTILFAFSLVGLVTLFGLKSFELSRNVKTPLELVRRRGDPAVREGLLNYRRVCRACSASIIRSSTIWFRTILRSAHFSFDRSLHAITLRLNRYLRERRMRAKKEGGNVSLHLKTVLEKSEENSSRENSL